MRYVQRLAASIITVFACASASAAVVASNATYGAIDGSAATRALNVTARGTIRDVNIGIEFSKCDDPPIGPSGTSCRGPGSPFENEIGFVLIAPNGQRVTLVESFHTYAAGSPGSSAGRVLANFDDEAAAATGPRVQAGSFRPDQMLSAFDGMDLFGSWTLYLQDFSPGDPLEFYSASLDIAYDPVPEPATLAMLGLGLGLMGMRAARKR